MIHHKLKMGKMLFRIAFKRFIFFSIFFKNVLSASITSPGIEINKKNYANILTLFNNSVIENRVGRVAGKLRQNHILHQKKLNKC